MKEKNPKPIVTFGLEQQVNGFLNECAEEIFTTDFIENPSVLTAVRYFGVNVEIVQKHEKFTSNKYEDGQQYVFIVLEFENGQGESVFAKLNGNLSSYGGLMYTDWGLVTPKTKTVQVFE